MDRVMEIKRRGGVATTGGRPKVGGEGGLGCG